MDEPLDDLYFNWLYAKVMLSDQPHLQYNTLIRALYDYEFVWLLVGDDNRAEDGIELRKEFIRETGIQGDESWHELGCSVLEMLIAFSRRAEFQTEIHPSEWFWQFIANLGLSEMYDEAFDRDYFLDVMHDFVWRTYDSDGSGGMFPLGQPNSDQRKVEIWYQFCEYLVELELA